MRALLIADRDVDAENISRMLTSDADPSIDLEVSSDVAAATDRLAEQDFDVVLLDLDVEVGTGLATLHELTHGAQHVPVVVLGSAPGRCLSTNVIQAGAQDYLPKDRLEADQLWRSLTYAVQRHQLERARTADSLRFDEAHQVAEIAEAHFRVVFESARDAIVVIDSEGRYRDANPSTVEMLGYSWEELRQRRASELEVGDREEAQRDFERLLTSPVGETSVRRDRRLRRKDGQVITVEQHTTRVELPIGPCLVSVWRDVTEQRHVSDALRQWADYFQHSEQGLFVAPPDPSQPGVCNPAYARMHGYTPEEIAALPRLALVTPEERPAIRELLVQLDAQDHMVFETIHRRKDGSMFPVLVDATSVRGDDGVVQYRILHFTDITERKRVEQERAALLAQTRMAESRYHGLFNAAADSILIVDEHQRIVEVNPSAVSLLGYDEPAEILGMSALDIVHGPKDLIRVAREQVDQLGHWHGEIEWRRRSGELVPVDVSLRVVNLPDRPLYVAAARNISDRKALEQLRKEFLAIVAHELRNPLAAILGWTQFLQRGSNPARAAAVIADQTQQLDRLIGDLLDVTRIDAGQLELRLQRIDMVQLAASVVEQEQASTSDHVISLEYSHPSMPLVADAQRIAQVVRNLLSNAIKYSPGSPRVLVKLIDLGDEVRVTVSDHGLGIQPEALDKIFERFARLEGGKDVARGSGLGLPIARALAEAHGGRLCAESDGPGQGSSFILALPRSGET